MISALAICSGYLIIGFFLGFFSSRVDGNGFFSFQSRLHRLHHLLQQSLEYQCQSICLSFNLEFLTLQDPIESPAIV